jgi:hypothetical protein
MGTYGLNHVWLFIITGISHPAAAVAVAVAAAAAAAVAVVAVVAVVKVTVPSHSLAFEGCRSELCTV